MDWFLAGDAEEVSELRQQIASYLRRHAAEGADVDGAELVVGELVTNALRHSGGTFWVSLEWPSARPVLTVRDLGPGFDLAETMRDVDATHVGGRGLFIASRIATSLRVDARRSGGAMVSAELPVHRPEQANHHPAPRRRDALPHVEEALPKGGFGKEAFLRALVVQLAAAVDATHGPDAADAAVAQVGVDVGGQMESEYRAARSIVDRLTPGQLGDCYVRLKHAIDGGFVVDEFDADRIVLVNDRCPFGDAVRRAPSLCRMTSSVFGGIAARNSDDGALVVLEERIALGDPGCRVVVWLDADHPDAAWGHRYPTPS